MVNAMKSIGNKYIKRFFRCTQNEVYAREDAVHALQLCSKNFTAQSRSESKLKGIVYMEYETYPNMGVKRITLFVAVF